MRLGRTDTDFKSSDLLDGSGNPTSYDSKSTYYGVHAGLGYVLDISDKSNIDFSTRSLWTHQTRDNVTVAGDPIHFDSMNSHRWRNGARSNYTMKTYSSAVI